ncbi:MAG TPA: hypothetical protein VLB27_03240, partial [candidate division Zixibacteria bacterium]|nr:hypothetical protein [candidate division Zixibacteria bacterium]
MSARNITAAVVTSCVVVLGLCAAATADVHVRHVTQMNMVGSPMPTIPEGLDTLDLWLNDYQAAISMGPAFTLLIDANTRAVHMIDHTEQTYSTFDLNFENALEDQMLPLNLEMDSLI